MGKQATQTERLASSTKDLDNIAKTLTGISQQSANTTEKLYRLQVAMDRADIVVQNLQPPDRPSLNLSGYVSFELRNNGRTPASTVKYNYAEGSFNVSTRMDKSVTEQIANTLPKEGTPWRDVAEISGEDSATQEIYFSDKNIDSILYEVGTIEYDDINGQRWWRHFCFEIVPSSTHEHGEYVFSLRRCDVMQDSGRVNQQKKSNPK